MIPLWSESALAYKTDKLEEAFLHHTYTHIHTHTLEDAGLYKRFTSEVF